MSEADSLTAEDLRTKLYHSLRDKGLVDALKSQLRNRLVSELQTVGLSQSFPKIKTKGGNSDLYAEDGSLIIRAANSLVADYLRHSSFDYTLSVFLPESGTVEDKIFTTRDLLRLLNISSESNLYKKLAIYNTESLDKKGFLWQLLCEIAKQHGQPRHDTGIQTDKAVTPLINNLQEEFEKLDQYYAMPEVGQSTRWGIEERMISYQRQLEERSRTEVNLEISRFKETELTRMRMEEREKYRKETEKMRRELDRTFQTKLEALVERERNSIERLQTQQQIQEKETFSQRQSILEEIDIVRKREAELRRQMELNLREKTLWEDRMKSSEELVKKREETVRRQEIEYEQHLQDEISKFRTEQEAKYLARNKDIEYREIRLKEDERRVKEELSDIKLVKDELREKRIKVNTLDADLQRVQHELLSTRNQNQLLSDKLRDMVDYQVLKDENTGLRRELENTKERLAETHRDLQIERQKKEEVLREMGERLAKPTPEHLLIQTELEKARGSLRHEQALFQHQQQQSQIQLNEHIDRNRDMMRRYEEQSMQLKEMNREIRDLRYQLTHTRSALDNEVYGKPRSIYPVRSRSPSMCDLPETTGAFEELPDRGAEPVYSSTDPELLFTRDTEEDAVSPAKTDVTKSEDYSYSSDIIEETKKRLRKLEREAENLESNYQNFHFRLTSVHASLPQTTAALSSHETRKSYRGHHKGTGNTNHSAHPGYASPLAKSTDRPLSSTPNRQPRPMSYRPYTPPNQEGTDLPKMNMSVSPVHSNPDIGRTTAVQSNRPISMADLEARPGSPSVVVVEGSMSHLPNTTPPEGNHHTDLRSSPPGQERMDSQQDTAWRKPVLGLDSAWKRQERNEVVSEAPSVAEPKDIKPSGPLTSTQKLNHQARAPPPNIEEERRKQEQEDREYEERRRQREEEKKKKEQEAWEREQQELDRLKRHEQGQTSPVEEKEDVKATGEATIDPVMQKYMDMVAAQKEKEKALAKRTITTWNKGRTLSEDKTPSVSEEISVAEEKSENGAAALDDFEW